MKRPPEWLRKIALIMALTGVISAVTYLFDWLRR